MADFVLPKAYALHAADEDAKPGSEFLVPVRMRRSLGSDTPLPTDLQYHFIVAAGMRHLLRQESAKHFVQVHIWESRCILYAESYVCVKLYCHLLILIRIA